MLALISIDPVYLLLNAGSIIGAATLLKLGLWLYCRRLRDHSPAMLALAEDHWNDVLSNLAGIITPTIAFYAPKVGSGKDPRVLCAQGRLREGSKGSMRPR